MARGVQQRFGAGLGIAATGIAGPTGGTPEKPVGLVYVALAGGPASVTVRNTVGPDRVRRSSTVPLRPPWTWSGGAC